MRHKYLEIAGTPSVKAAQAHYGSRAQYARLERGDVVHDRLGPDEAAFVAARDGFYLASVSGTGWPYVQYRGGPAGFLRVLDPATLGFADFRGNRQYITVGNTAADGRVSLFLMDYARRERLKVFGRLRFTDAQDDPALAERLAVPEYPGRVERSAVIAVEAFDWNCPQHITPRYTEGELAELLGPVRERLAALEAENAALRRALAGADRAPPA